MTNETQLQAPLAFLDEGFSSDGAFISGVETDPGTPIVCEETDFDGPPTPTMMDRPEVAAAQDPARVPEAWGSKAPLPHEGGWESAGLIAQDDDSPEDPIPPGAPTPSLATLATSGSRDLERSRTEFTVQPLSRPRATTPLQNTAIEDFIASAPVPERKDDQPLAINLPSSVVPVSKKPLHRRQSSQTWSEFAEIMSQSREPADMFDTSGMPVDKVPPSPVVHRRSSKEWVSFGEDLDDEIPAPQLTKPLPKLEDYLSGNRDFTLPAENQDFPTSTQNQDFSVTKDLSCDFDVASERGGTSDMTEESLPQPAFSSSEFDAHDDVTSGTSTAFTPRQTVYPPATPQLTDASRTSTDVQSDERTSSEERSDYTLQSAEPDQQVPYPVENYDPETYRSTNDYFEPTSNGSIDNSASYIVAPAIDNASYEPTKVLSIDDPDFVPPTVTIDEHFIEYSSDSSRRSSDVYTSAREVQPQEPITETVEVTEPQDGTCSEDFEAKMNNNYKNFEVTEAQPFEAEQDSPEYDSYATNHDYGETEAEYSANNQKTTESYAGEVSAQWTAQTYDYSQSEAQPQPTEPTTFEDDSFLAKTETGRWVSFGDEDQSQAAPGFEGTISSPIDAIEKPPPVAATKWISFGEDESTPPAPLTSFQTQPGTTGHENGFVPDTTHQYEETTQPQTYEIRTSEHPEISTSEHPEISSSEHPESETSKKPPPRPAPPPPRPAPPGQPKIAPLTGPIRIALPGPKDAEHKRDRTEQDEDQEDAPPGTSKPAMKKQATTDSSSDDEPYVPPSASPPRMPGDEKPSNEPSEDWKAFLAMTDRVSGLMKATQDRLAAIKETTAIKDLKTIPKYMNMKDEEGNPVDENKDLMKTDAKTPDKAHEWKDVSEILNEDIKKKKEASKPSRPPPPPTSVTKPKPTRNPSLVNYDPLNPSWDDDTVQEYYKASAISAAQRQETIDESRDEPVDESRDQPEDRQAEPEAEPEPEKPKWTPIEEARLPSSDSGFFAQARSEASNTAFTVSADTEDDPFAVKTVDEIVAEAKAKAKKLQEGQDPDSALFGDLAGGTRSNESSKTGSPDSPPHGFEDSFVKRAIPHGDDSDYDDDLPLYDEDDSQPLIDFPPKFTGDGWNLMIRFPLKKRFMADRYWKTIYVRFKPDDNVLSLYHSQNDQKSFQDIPILPNYSLSAVELQPYDIYGKIHTVKLQQVAYKERVGIRPGQIPKLVEGHFSKLGMPLEHAAISSQILKLGSLDYHEMTSFVNCIEDALFHITSGSAHISGSQDMQYKQDEVQIHVYDEYSCHVDKDGIVSDQLARVRIFCLSFITGAVMVELGLNDRRRQGKEVVRRKDIMPLYTDRWIRFENLEFHSVVNRSAFDGADHVLSFRPMDACFFELMRFRVRPPKCKELPLSVRATMKICGSKIEIRIEAMIAAFRSRRAHQVPCEDIQIRFPVPEAWIYLFREERHWGVGSVHGRVRRPGKMKNIKDRLMGMVQHLDNCLIEIATGEAKYEHVFRALVWRIPMLPDKHHGAYKNHLLRCRFDLSSFDLMPEAFIPTCDVEFTMPMATVSSTVVRSVSVEQHEDPDTVEKFVRYLAKYQYRVDIDYVQVSQLDMDAIVDTTVVDPERTAEIVPEQHRPSIDINEVKAVHEGYRIEFDPSEVGGHHQKSESASSDEEEEEKSKSLMIQIDMKGYGYEQ